MTAYMMSHVTITNKAKFESYLSKTKVVGGKYGGKPVAVGTQPKMLNGESDGHQMVFVVEFPTMEKLDEWHSSNEYQAIVSLRDEGSVQHMVAYEGKVMSPS